MRKLYTEIQLNKEQEEVLELIMSGANVCVLGAAGTGKSELIKRACSEFEKKGKKVQKVCLQGIAAQLIGGRTIHSAFRFPYNLKNYIPTRANLEFLNGSNVLIIDEIGMVSKHLMDIIGECLSHRDGELQLIVVGDFYQIEPIHKGSRHVQFAFESYYWDKFNYIIKELKTVVRQGNMEYVKKLNALRVGDGSSLYYFSKNACKNWIDGAITICTHRLDAERINRQELAKLKGIRSRMYYARYEGEIEEDEMLGEKCLEVKIGMRVISTINSNMGYKNGSMGEVVGYNDDYILVRFDYDGKIYHIGWITTSMVRIDREAEHNETEVVLIPLRPAYAITIHKSQGHTFEKVNIIIGVRGTFACGQLYVALSRCCSVENMHISGNIYGCNIEPNPKVTEFYRQIYFEERKGA